MAVKITCKKATVVFFLLFTTSVNKLTPFENSSANSTAAAVLADETYYSTFYLHQQSSPLLNVYLKLAKNIVD